MRCVYSKSMILLLVVAAMSVQAADDIGQFSSSSSNAGSLLSLWLAAREDQRESLPEPVSGASSSSSDGLASLLQVAQEECAPPAQRKRRVHIDGPHRCGSCNIGFRERGLLRSHLATKRHKRSLGEELTEEERDNIVRQQLKGLCIKRARIDSSYQCDSCNIGFRERKLLQVHLATKSHKRSLGEELTEEERDNIVQRQLEELRIKRARGQLNCVVCNCLLADETALELHGKTSKHIAQAAKALYVAGQYNEVLTYGRTALVEDELSFDARNKIEQLVRKCESLLVSQPVASSSSSSSSSSIGTDVQVIDGLKCRACNLLFADKPSVKIHQRTSRHAENLAFLELLAQPVTLSQEQNLK